MQIDNDTYSVIYEATTQTVHCRGSLRLSGVQEYAPIVELLDNAVSQQPSVLTLALDELEFLNSSGINVLSKFVISVRQRQGIGLIVQGSKIPWQSKSLQNLQRLMPALQLVLN